jgi:hypothetical protein
MLGQERNKMTQPLSLEVTLSELDVNAEAWVLQDMPTGKYVIIPDSRYPGRKPVRFFMRREDAEAVLMELIDVNPNLSQKEIYPVKVRLIPAIKGIASDTNPDNADAFVVHSVNEVYEFLREG